MNKRIIFIPVFVIIASCTSTVNRKDDLDTENRVVQTVEISTKKIHSFSGSKSESINEVAFIDSMCTILIKELLQSSKDSPSAFLSEEGHYLLDVKSHVDQLRRTELFTEHFLQNEFRKFEKCADVLRRKKIKVEDLEVGIEMEGPIECNFLNYMYYYQSQEAPKRFELLNTSLDTNIIRTEMHFYDESEGERYSWDNRIYLVIEITNDSSEIWKFDRVEKILK